MLNFKVEGMNAVLKGLEELGNVPQKHVTASVRKGMNIVLKDAKKKAPPQGISLSSIAGTKNKKLGELRGGTGESSGDLKRGIILIGEKAASKGKKAYQLVMSYAFNSFFQKPIAHPGYTGSKKNPPGKPTKSGNTNKQGYYPVSQEYGYYAKNGRYIPGLMFGHEALDDNKGAVEKTIIESMKKKIDAEIAKRGLK